MKTLRTLRLLRSGALPRFRYLYISIFLPKTPAFPGTGNPARGTRHGEPGTGNPARGTRHGEPGTGNPARFDLKSSQAAFEVKPLPSELTRAASFPDALYNLEVRQYDGTSGAHLNGVNLGNVTIGSKVTVPLTPSDDCQLVIVARGDGNTVPELGTKSLSDVQTTITANSTVMNTLTDINKMPYVLHLKHVKVADAGDGNGTIRSAENGTSDVRLLLKRLAVRVTLNWALSEAMQSAGYELKEVKLCQVPSSYYLLPAREETEWGTTYPSTVSEFVDVYRLTDAELTAAAGSKTVWIPANVRGVSSASSAPIHRTTENAPTAASYAELVVDNSVKKERLYYRAYLGSEDPTDFNLCENTNYNWTIRISSANYTTDPRIQLLDQTPVESDNLVPTSNCLMLPPGGNLCFNPYQHSSGTNGWNDYLVNTPSGAPAAKTPITSVKVLWQTKDAGTSGNLVLGYVVDDNHHENLVHITNAGDINQARVHVKAPVTEGGNAVIAAYAEDGTTILWSWHIWVTDYAPVGISDAITDDNSRASAIAAAKTATRGGTVHAYDGSAWINPAGAFYKKVIMDRHLGAIRNTYSTTSTLDAARAYGMLYQWGRKDPIPGSADGSATEIDVIYDGYGVAQGISKISVNSLGYSIQHPIVFCKGLSLPNNSWGGYASKTIYDPCPDGWRVPDFLDDDNHNLLQGFALQDGGNVKVLVVGKWQNTEFTVSQSSFDITNGFLYKESVWLPIVRMREIDGSLRDPYSRGKFDSDLIPSFVIWGAAANGGIGVYYEAKNTMINMRPSVTVSAKPYGFSVRCIQE